MISTNQYQGQQSKTVFCLPLFFIHKHPIPLSANVPIGGEFLDVNQVGCYNFFKTLLMVHRVVTRQSRARWGLTEAWNHPMCLFYATCGHENHKKTLKLLLFFCLLSLQMFYEEVNSFNGFVRLQDYMQLFLRWTK